LRTLFWALLHEQWRELSVAQLLQITSIHEECKKIWETLSSVEQQFVQLLALQSAPLAQPESLALLAELRLKGIVCEDTPTLFSPIFVLYVLHLVEDKLSGVSVDSRKRQVRLDGQLLDPPLSALEFKLLEYLAKRSGEVCHTTDLLRELYNDEVYTKNDQRLYALLTRVRKALGETAQLPRYIVTHHGGGVQLLKGRITDS
jgi:DNA-binding winged helix-turn-helix (wHTH) protein